MWILNKSKVFELLLYYGSYSPESWSCISAYPLDTCATLHHHIYGYSFPSMFDLSSFLYG